MEWLPRPEMGHITEDQVSGEEGTGEFGFDRVSVLCLHNFQVGVSDRESDTQTRAWRGGWTSYLSGGLLSTDAAEAGGAGEWLEMV